MLLTLPVLAAVAGALLVRGKRGPGR
jgi:hypothetical protein